MGIHVSLARTPEEEKDITIPIIPQSRRRSKGRKCWGNSINLDYFDKKEEKKKGEDKKR